MSNLPLQSAVNHNDDNDEQTNSATAMLSAINSRITSPLIIKRQQNTETEIANNQAYDEIHDIQPKHSLSKRISNDNTFSKNSTRHQANSNDLMQGNYYDRTRYDIDYSSSLNQQAESTPININVEEYKKTFAPFSTNKNSNNKNRTRSPPFGDTSESIQQGIVQSAGMLLERNKKPDHHHHQHKNPTKNNNKSHEEAAINYFPSSDDNKQRSLSPSSSECSTSDSSTSNKCQDDNNKSNIPYEKLLNDDDNDDELIEQSKKPLTESTTLLNKNHSQTYGTQSTSTTTNITYERGKCLPNNGYNSHGSSITTKSSSDNSGSIRTNSCTDNDEESDEEHYNNSTVSNNHLPMTLSRMKDTPMKSSNKSNGSQYSCLNDQTNYQSRQSNMTQITNNNETHLQVPRMKQTSIDDFNGNTNKLNSGTEHNSVFFSSKSSLQQQQSINQSNLLSSSSSSSHPNRNINEHNPNSSRTNSHQQGGGRGTKKRKQPQQEIIRTESIPGHRGDRDVDELVMFIDGDSSRQRQNSTPLRPTDTNKLRLTSKISSVNDTNSNKTSLRKKSRKNNNEIKTSTIEQNSPSDDLVSQSATNSITDITNKSLELRNISSENHDEAHSNTNSTNTTNSQMSLPTWYEQTQTTSSVTDDIDSYSLSSITTANNLNSDTIYEPFVTVTNRRRLPKERRQENNVPPRSARFVPPSKPNDKRRVPSSIKNGFVRPAVFTNQSNNKPATSSVPKEEIHNRKSIEPVRSSATDEPSHSSTIVNSLNEQSIEKPQLSPRLSTHSSSSSSSSLLKRHTKPPPVVFLNRSNDIELNGVSFGFELDSTISDKSLDNNEVDKQQTTTEVDTDVINRSVSPSNKPPQSNDMLSESMTQKSNKRFQQRNNRSPHFYSGSDIRPHQQRNYPSQPMPPSSYIDPLLLFQYNQRLANYPQQLAYMNLLRPPYVSPQSQYFFLPTTYATPPPATTAANNEADTDDTNNQTSSDQVQEPLLFYATPSGQFYFQPKKPTIDSEQQQPTVPPTLYAPTQPMYPSHYFYPPHVQHLIPPQTAYFQPIPPTSSLVIDTKLEPKNLDMDDDDDDDGGYKNSPNVYPQTRQQTSSDIMSNALQLVYSQQRRNAQTDRFNLDDLTAYLAMKWTDTVDHYEQGDNRIILVNDHT